MSNIKLTIERPAEGNPRAILTGEDGTTVVFEQGGGGGGGGGAPTDAQYLVAATNGTLSAERVLGGESGVLTVDYATPGAATVTVDAGGIGTTKLAARGVTYAKMPAVTQDRLLGRVSAGSGDAEEVTASQARTLLNVEDGAAAPPYGTADLSDGAVTLAKLANVTSDRLIGRDSTGAGAPEELAVGGGLEFTGSGGIQRAALTGAVTASAGSGTTSISAGAVGTTELADGGATNAKLANMAEATVKGRAAGAGTGSPVDLTAAQLRAIANVEDGAAAPPYGTSDLGDGAVSNAKLADVATSTIKGRATAGTGDPEDLSVSQVKILLGTFSTSETGLVPSPTSGDVSANRVLRADGAWTDQTGGGGGAPLDAEYLVSSSNGTLSAERVLSGESGVVSVDTGTPGSAVVNIDAGGIGTAKLADGSVDNTKAADMAAATIKGRASGAGTGDPTDLSASQVRTIINVEDGAAADQSAAEVPYSNSTSGLSATHVQGAIDEIDAALDALASGMVFSGDFDAGGGSGPVNFPGSGSAQAGAFYVVTNAASGGTTVGTTNAIVVHTGDQLVARQDNASTTNGAQWVKLDSTDAVSAVAGKTGSVTLVPSDLSSVSTSTILGRATAGTGAAEQLSASQVRTLLNVEDGANAYAHPNHTGDVTSSGDGAQTIASGAVTNSKLANVSTSTIKGRATAGTGSPEDLTASQVRTLINVADGANAYSHPNHSGDVTSVGDGAQTIAANAVDNSKAADMAAYSLKLRNAGTSGDPQDVKVSALTELASPTSGDWLLGEASTGELRKIDVGNLPTGGGVSLPVNDTTSIVQDPADGTKEMRIDVGAVATGTVRTLTMPNQDIDLTPGTGSFATEAEGNLAATALQNVAEDTTPQLGGQLDVNGQALGDGTRELLTFVEDGSAVNQLEVENQATGSGPILRATGDDTNVDLHLDCKGSGQVVIDANLDVQGSVSVTGTVDGRDVAADGTKLDGIESGAAAPPYGTGDLSDGAVTYAKLQDISTSDRLLGRDSSGAGDAEEIAVGGGLEFTGSGGIQRSALTGDVSASAGSNATTIANDSVTYAKMQNVSTTDRLLGRDSAGAGDVEELSVGGGLEFSGSGGIQRSALTGDVTASAGSGSTTIADNAVTTSKILNANVTLAKIANIASSRILGRTTIGSGAPEELSVGSSLGLSLGTLSRAALTGDVTAGSDSNATTIANDAVTNAKMANMSQHRFKGRTSSGSGDPEDLTSVQAMASLLAGGALHYGCWYGGVVTLASGSDTVVAFGVEGQNSGNFSLASNVLTVTNPCVALLIWYSIMVEATVSGEAQVSIQLEEDPDSGTFGAITGTRKDGAINAGDVDLDRNTISGFWIVAPGADYKYRITGRIQSGGATAKTVAAGSSILMLGLSNA